MKPRNPVALASALSSGILAARARCKLGESQESENRDILLANIQPATAGAAWS